MKNNRVRIEIDTRTFVRFWLVVIGFVLALGLIYLASKALIIVGVSIFLAMALNPPVSHIAKRLPGKSRIGATALAYVIVVSLLAGFIVLVVPPVIEQSARFAERVPDFIETASTQWAFADDVIDQYGLREQFDEAIAAAQAQANDFAKQLSVAFVTGASAVISAAASTFIVLVMTFLMLMEGPTWLKKFWAVYRDDKRREHHRRVALQMYRVVTGYVNGQLLVAAIGAIAAAVAVLILSAIFPLPANLAMPIAAIVFITSLIPMFGATIGGVLAAILLAFNDIPAAIFFVIYFVVYQQLENNFISPVVQSRTVDLSAMMVLIALTIGLMLFGVIGGIIAIPIAGCLRVLLIDYLERRKVSTKEI